MKEKIIIFIVGLLLGAIIATGSIYVYTLANSGGNNNGQTMQMPNGNFPNNQMGGNNQPPEMPGGANFQNNNQTNSN